MSLAYLILEHKSPDQVDRLFRAIYHADDFFVLHFDHRAESDLHALAQTLVQRHPNVIVLPSRSILWGGSVMAEVQIAAMNAALQGSSGWHHFVNLSGQDFPLKSRDEIIERLAAHKNSSFVSWFDPLASGLWKNARQRLTRYHLEWPWLLRLLQTPVIGRRLRIFFGWQNGLPRIPFFQRTWPHFFRYYGGANHVVLNREACRYLNTSPDARRIARWLRHSAHANEIIFQSVLLNSPLAPAIVNAHFREIVFPSTDSPHPTTLTQSDLPRLLSSPALFARKFDLAKDAMVVRALEKRIQRSETLCS